MKYDFFPLLKILLKLLPFKNKILDFYLLLLDKNWEINNKCIWPKQKVKKLAYWIIILYVVQIKHLQISAIVTGLWTLSFYH